MTRSKNANKKRGKKRGDAEPGCSNTKRHEDKRLQPITSIFKGEEIQEIAGILGVVEPDDSQTFLGAVVLNKFDVVKKLLKDGFSIDGCKEDGVTPLMWAIRLKHREMAELLIKRGANLNLEDKDGNTALMAAIYTKTWTQDLFIDLWNLIKDSGVNINHFNKTGNTMLHLAVKRNWDVVVDLISMDGANPNLSTNKGVTPIMLACSRHQVNIIETLLAHSADLSMEDQKGCTACCYAIAYMIQKQIATMDFAVEEMISFMRNDATKISVKSYLKRRLELLQNPPDGNFSKTICSVIVHVLTFFVRFVSEGVTVLLQLNVFRSLRNAIEKHIEDNEYVVALLKILIELVRYCECCTPHIPWDNVALAFNEAGIPCICLRLQKRFENSRLLHETFLPLFLTCKHPMTKLWLQKNFKSISPLYRLYIQMQSTPSEYNYYPNEAHSQMVRKSSLHFKQLMGQLQRGNTITQEQKQPKKKKEKPLDKKKTLQDLNFFKKNDTELKRSSALNMEDNLKQLSKEENIIVAVISNKKKEEVPIATEESKSDSQETYWPLDKVNNISNKTKEIEAEIIEEQDDQIIYPKWKEDFKEGCQLFGIQLENKSNRTEQEMGSGDTLPQPDEARIEMEKKISELDELFDKVLNIYDRTWQEDYSHGYENVNSDIKDYLKLMYTLPNMEMYHWMQVTEKWKELIKMLRLKWTESGDKIIPDLQVYLKSFADRLSDIQVMQIACRHNDIGITIGEYEETQQKTIPLISIEQFIRENQEEMHLKIKKENIFNDEEDDDIDDTDGSKYKKIEENVTSVINKPQGNSSGGENYQPVENTFNEEVNNKSSIQTNEDHQQVNEKKVADHSELGNHSVRTMDEDNTAIVDNFTNKKEKTSLEIGENVENSESQKNVSELNNCLPSTTDEDAEESLEIWMVMETNSLPSKVPPPPPGFNIIPEVSKLQEVYQGNWRQTNFVESRYTKLLTTLRCMRSILVQDIILPPTHMQMHFLVGHGGSFGPVTLALDINSGKPIMVKRILQNESIALQIRAWKIHSLMRRLLHVHSEFLVPYTHFIDVERFILLATPLCQRNLNEHMLLLKTAGYFTRERAMTLVRQTMAGLHYLHSQEPPIIHGNMKPTNLLIDAAGNLRLADFGIYETISQQICTSIQAAVWWARETYWHYNIDWKIMVTRSSDVQVLGMLSHYILTGGLHPYGRTPKEISRAVIHGKPILRLDNHEALDLISWMLSSFPKERPSTDEIMKHVFNWNKEKKWKFLLTCAGVPMQGVSLGLVLEQFHYSIDRYAREQKVTTEWSKNTSKQLHSALHKSETLSGLLNLLRDNLPSSASWFMSVFPSLPLVLFRLLEDSPWFSHPDLAQFKPV